MGLITGLLTLPLAPVRGTIWLAEQLAEQAAAELDDERQIRRRLAEIERQHALGEISSEELAALEDDLLERLRLAGGLDREGWSL